LTVIVDKLASITGKIDANNRDVNMLGGMIRDLRAAEQADRIEQLEREVAELKATINRLSQGGGPQKESSAPQILQQHQEPPAQEQPAAAADNRDAEIESLISKLDAANLEMGN
jgi:hypothetical protein